MFKFALDSGHYRYTPGKRCLKSIDPNETREWILNNRICVKVEEKLKPYDGYSLLRVDDTTGEKEVTLAQRVKKANDADVDFYLSVHHNAGINGGKGGGIISIVHPKASAKSKEYQKILYDDLIKHTRLKGNRSTPLPLQNLYVCGETRMPAVLLECGFMDSTVDTPIILTDTFAENCANAIVESLVKIGGLKKKEIPAEATSTTTSNKIYRVQVGAFSVKANAEALRKRLQDDGYDAMIV
jgi:N-acetylmuramoyl-L-alanine amidase